MMVQQLAVAEDRSTRAERKVEELRDQISTMQFENSMQLEVSNLLGRGLPRTMHASVGYPCKCGLPVHACVGRPGPCMQV